LLSGPVKAVLVRHSSARIALNSLWPLDAGLLDIASDVIEQLASKEEQLSKNADHDDLNVGSFTETFRAQYLLLRITLVRFPDLFHNLL
jgi:hypothetical protein